MQVRLIRPIAFRKIDTVLDVADGVAELWILQRKVERVVEPTPQVDRMVPTKNIDVSFRQRKNKMSVA